MAFSVIWQNNHSADWLAALTPLWWLRHQRGNAFPTSARAVVRFSSGEARLSGFRRQRRHKKWRRRRRTSPAQRYYITPEGESPQPVREASADPGQNPGSPRPKGPAAGSTLTPVRACQPSGILESTAQVPVPIPTAPKAPEPSRPKGACHLCSLYPSSLRI